jgi:cellulose synthase/poly-beta-1,6-N-acetylglucosamine synthase-like glycosyltransferase
LILYDILRYGHGIFFVALQTMLMFGFFLEWLRDRRICARSGTGPGSVKVSVIIPIHNEARRMGGLLKSLLEQDFQAAEIIFVDDRSSDESPAMLAQFVRDAAGRGMGNCRVITLKENPGPNRKQYALARGIAGATGEYFLFTDGD